MKPTIYFLFILSLSITPKLIADEMPKVVIVTTGGTIAEKIDPAIGAAVPAVSGEDLIKAVPGLAKFAKIDVVNFSNIDSSQMTPEIWAKLSKEVDGLLKSEKYKGAVVTHGTDTMAEGAFFLETTLKSKKPVVFVGSMRNASDISPDGPANIFDAVLQICSEKGSKWGVTVTMNDYINSAKHVCKTQTTNVQTFKSGEFGYLGYIVGDKVIHINDKPETTKIPLDDKLPDVALLTTFAGDDGRFIRHAVDSGSKGIVVEGVGAGNVNAEVFKAIKYAISKKIAVVITTRVPNGGVYPIYGDEGGGSTLEKAGAVMAGTYKGPKARLILMLALGQERDDPSKLKKYFK